MSQGANLFSTCIHVLNSTTHDERIHNMLEELNKQAYKIVLVLMFYCPASIQEEKCQITSTGLVNYEQGCLNSLPVG